MSKWIRNYDPTEIDGDEWDNILVLRENGQKLVCNWEDYVDDGMREQGCAWMPLPQSDIPKWVFLTIEVGDRSYTIENNGATIEIHDSRHPLEQPTTFQHDGDTIGGILEAVDGILQEELHPEWIRSAEVVNDTVLQGFIDALRGNVDEDELMTQDTIDIATYKKNRAAGKKPWQK